jgi:hypothetical protein
MKGKRFFDWAEWLIMRLTGVLLWIFVAIKIIRADWPL